MLSDIENLEVMPGSYRFNEYTNDGGSLNKNSETTDGSSQGKEIRAYKMTNGYERPIATEETRKKVRRN